MKVSVAMSAFNKRLNTLVKVDDVEDADYITFFNRVLSAQEVAKINAIGFAYSTEGKTKKGDAFQRWSRNAPVDPEEQIAAILG